MFYNCTAKKVNDRKAQIFLQEMRFEKNQAGMM